MSPYNPWEICMLTCGAILLVLLALALVVTARLHSMYRRKYDELRAVVEKARTAEDILAAEHAVNQFGFSFCWRAEHDRDVRALREILRERAAFDQQAT